MSQQQPDDRREALRREEDIETREIVDHAVHDAPIVHQLLRTWRVAVMVGGMCALLGSAAGAGAAGYRVAAQRSEMAQITQRVDSNTAHIAREQMSARAERDSILDAIKAMRSDLREIKLTSCQMMRRFASDLRPDGCEK